jgi:tetratricopeptide (TPR) repeat protein
MGRSLAERLRNQREQAKADKLLGGAYYNQGDYGRAIEFSERSLSLFIDVSDIQEQAGVYMNLGNVQHELGRWQEARASYEASARLAAAIGNTHEQAFVANNLGDVLRSLGDFDGAIQQFQIALAGLRKSLYGSGVAAMNLGASYLLRGDLNLAQQELERSDKLFAEAGTDSFLPELLRYQAELSLARGDPVAAAAICRNALERAAQLGARLEEGTARRVLGQALAMQGDLPVAHTELLASEAICIEAGSRYELARTHLQLADVEARLGQHTIAAERITGALAALSDLGARHDIAVAEQIAAQYRLLRQDS